MPGPLNSGVIDGVELWDGRSHRGAVRLSWRDGAVEAIEGAPGSAAMSGSGLSVIPGLVDTHVHLDVPVADAGPADLGWGAVTSPEEQAVSMVMLGPRRSSR